MGSPAQSTKGHDCGHSNPFGSVVCSKCRAALEDMATITGGDATDWSRVGSGEAMTSLALVPGNVVANRYEIIRLLGEGGMGAVYKARDRELDRLIAL